MIRFVVVGILSANTPWIRNEILTEVHKTANRAVIKHKFAEGVDVSGEPALTHGHMLHYVTD